MQYAAWVAGEFVNALALNLTETLTQASFAALGAGLHTSGVFHASATSFSISGLTLISTLPAPFGVLFSSGVLSQGFGTTPGISSAVYTTSFASLVPGSGSVTAYLVANNTGLGLLPIEIVGPPVGHPDYDPSFAPFTTYSKIADSLALTATLTPADNVTTVEIGRFTLIAGQTVLNAIDTTHQIRAGAILSQNGEVISADLAPTGVAAGTYTLTEFGVGADGRVTFAESFGFSTPINPNGPAAGAAAGISNIATLAFDYGNNLIWECIVGGAPGTAQYQVLNGKIGEWTELTGSAGLTVPSWATIIEAMLVGGGGGGANCQAGSPPGLTSTSGGGGGAGGFTWGWFAVTPGQILTCVVGAGGSAQNSGNPSSIAGLLANGGAGAAFQSVNSSAGAVGGSASGGNILVSFGGCGSDGQSAGLIFAGNGADGPWGGSGRAGNAAGLNGRAPGAGGGGAYDSAASSNVYPGGHGAAGVIIYRWRA